MSSRALSARALLVWTCLVLALSTAPTWGQSFGVESHNTLMPASAGMGGVSIARPQDVTSAINANPASLAQLEGTQFTLGAAWAEATMNLTQTAPLPLLGVQPFSAKSSALGVLGGNIAASQGLDVLGLPATFGAGLITNAAGGADYRQVPQSNGTNTQLSVLEGTFGLGVQVTDNLALGAGGSMGIGIMDGPFVDIGGMTVDYAMRGVLGLDYKLTPQRNVGMYYQTKQAFTFDNAVQFQGPLQTLLSVNMDLPENLGFGYADSSFMGGRLLLACDVLYKLWDNAALYDSLYDNQWVLQLGTQYDLGRVKLRAGYVYAENPLSPTPGPNLGGIIEPGGIPAVYYSQSLLAITCPNRVSAGFGVKDVLPNMDFDAAVGGMFRDTEQLGNFTTSSITSYWVVGGLTWRYGQCCRPAQAKCCPTPAYAVGDVAPTAVQPTTQPAVQ